MIWNPYSEWFLSHRFLEADSKWSPSLSSTIFHWIIWFELFPTSTSRTQRKDERTTAISWNGSPFSKHSQGESARYIGSGKHGVMSMFLSYPTIALWSGGLITGWWLSRLLRDRGNNPNRLPLPPGPKGYPVIDNLFDLTADKLWKVFDKWSKTYGTFCIEQRLTHSLHGIHRRYGILQDTRAAISYSWECRKDLWFIWETLVELLWSPAFSHARWNVGHLLSVYVESRSPESRMDYTWNMAFQQYGLRWRSHRRTFHDYFHPNIVNKYQSVQITTARVLLRRLLGSPDDFMQHIR